MPKFLFFTFFLVILIVKLVFWWTDDFKEMKILSEVEGADEPGLYHSFNQPVQGNGLQFSYLQSSFSKLCQRNSYFHDLTGLSLTTDFSALGTRSCQ